MRKSRKKWVTWLIVSAIMALSVMIGSVSLAATDLSSEVYLAQQGSSTCTLASAAMMIRARFYKSGFWNFCQQFKIIIEQSSGRNCAVLRKIAACSFFDGL